MVLRHDTDPRVSLQRFHWLAVGATWVLALAAAFCVVEFIADKIPVVDSVWDGYSTFIRVPVGAAVDGFGFLLMLSPTTRLLRSAWRRPGPLSQRQSDRSTWRNIFTRAFFSNGILSLLEDALTVFYWVWPPLILGWRRCSW